MPEKYIGRGVIVPHPRCFRLGIPGNTEAEYVGDIKLALDIRASVKIVLSNLLDFFPAFFIVFCKNVTADFCDSLKTTGKFCH